MNLASLQSKLETVINTDIQKVVFDFSTILNQDFEKEYPLVFWDLDNSKWTKELRGDKSKVTMDCFILGSIDENNEDKINVWDTLESQFDTYLLALNQLSNLFVSTDGITKEYYPAGLLTVDNEVGIRYALALILWC